MEVSYYRLCYRQNVERSDIQLAVILLLYSFIVLVKVKEIASDCICSPEPPESTESHALNAEFLVTLGPVENASARAVPHGP